MAIGDFVHVASTPGKRNAFDGRVRSVHLDQAGTLIDVTVTGAAAGRVHGWHTVTPERITTFNTETQQKMQQSWEDSELRKTLAPKPRKGRR